MDSYKNKLGDLANKLKQEPKKIPIQEVSPVKETVEKEPEVQFNNWIPKKLLKRLKAYGLEHEISLKDINTQALELFLRTEVKTE